MAHKVIIKLGAELDVMEALEWYGEEKEELALDFIQRLDDELDRISKNPEHFQKGYRNIKIVFTRRFPYGIHYTLENDIVFVHAVMHMKRKPRK
ncbi:ParE toxin of type II toxin-antitoxin system, parDE [Pricia antarctica]|uniref:ParE toxin of type II toxin-antitoxin system, parDE n=1 Tax=Pricia antarctica TaxID=641691 RepID=A0A1G7C838_9FLAO|nr:type II toxin-antitoxin system RelE/ParE family toxin [Pricia antarctica]SDE35542.1 ParE toxin of type II toxin-antitoxin system, parDE [Pricia antarctica]